MEIKTLRCEKNKEDVALIKIKDVYYVLYFRTDPSSDIFYFHGEKKYEMPKLEKYTLQSEQQDGEMLSHKDGVILVITNICDHVLKGEKIFRARRTGDELREEDYMKIMELIQ